jgi:hypothetical protein
MCAYQSWISQEFKYSGSFYRKELPGVINGQNKVGQEIGDAEQNCIEAGAEIDAGVMDGVYYVNIIGD